MMMFPLTILEVKLCVFFFKSLLFKCCCAFKETERGFKFFRHLEYFDFKDVS